MKAKKKTNEWQWEKVRITLTDPNGDTVVLNSEDLSDWFMEQCFQELQDYVEEKGGELK
jgi:hypothetical protein